MADKSTIQWTDATWNPTVGCSIVSPGCTNCYAMKVANGLERRFRSKKYGGLTKIVNGNAVWTGEVRLDEGALLQPLRWKKPRRIFVNSMSDLFHEALSDEAIDRVLAVIALCPQHTFQVLTKRAERMARYLGDVHVSTIGGGDLCVRISDRCAEFKSVPFSDVVTPAKIRYRWPLHNVWLGVSCERQQEADERIPLLLKTPAAVRFISAEPLLGPLDLDHLKLTQPDEKSVFRTINALTGRRGHGGKFGYTETGDPLQEHLSWCIIGGESGPGARPMRIEWAAAIIEQCKAAGVAVFCKQLGGNPRQAGDIIGDTGFQALPQLRLVDRAGGDPTEWPEHLRVREFPQEPARR